MNKMIELKLIMFGIPKTEIDKMSRNEVQVLLHLMSYLNRQQQQGNEVEQ